MKVSVEFPASFEGETHPIEIGRLHLGRHIARLYFKTDGTVGMIVPKAAIDDGSLMVLEPIAGIMFGFPRSDDGDLSG